MLSLEMALVTAAEMPGIFFSGISLLVVAALMTWFGWMMDGIVAEAAAAAKKPPVELKKAA